MRVNSEFLIESKPYKGGEMVPPPPVIGVYNNFDIVIIRLNTSYK